MSREPILYTENLRKSYGTKEVVKGVNLLLRKGEIVGLLGPNGAGKTTTFHMIVGFVRPTAGKIYLGDQDITELPVYKRAKLGITYLPQEPSVFRGLSVRENIEVVLEEKGVGIAERRRIVTSLLIDFGLERVKDTKGGHLSGGERRRTEIARALATDPKFILLDEPFAGIDPIAVDDIQKIIISLKTKGIGILITDHNVRETLKITDRAYIIREGELFKEGSPSELSEDEEVRNTYLGKEFVL